MASARAMKMASMAQGSSPDDTVVMSTTTKDEARPHRFASAKAEFEWVRDQCKAYETKALAGRPDGTRLRRSELSEDHVKVADRYMALRQLLELQGELQPLQPRAKPPTAKPTCNHRAAHQTSCAAAHPAEHRAACRVDR